MTSRAIGRSLVRVCLVLLTLTAGVAGSVLLVKGQNSLVLLIVGGLLATIVSFVPLGLIAGRISGAHVPSVSVDTAGDALAEAARRQWEAAALERRLTYPETIPIRWRWSTLAVTGPVTDAVGSGNAQSRFAPLPGTTRISAAQLESGRIQDLFGVYAGLDSGRIIVLGGQGTGKTGTAIMLVTDALRHRDQLAERERRQTPVPVLLNCRNWDPRRMNFAEWVAEQLKSTYRFLRATEYGDDAAERLVAQGRVAVVLDGFDEASDEVRPAILGRLDTEAHCRVVLLSRNAELVDAAGNAHLAGAAALELLPVSRAEAADYLARCRVQPSSDAWRRLVSHVRDSANSAVAEALNNPLTLTLVRDTIHVDSDADLLDPRRYSDSAEVVAFLLDRVVPAAYSDRPGRPVPRYTEQQARRWLSYVARQMHTRGTHDLAWWQIPTWQPPLFRIAMNAVVAGAAFVAVGWVAFGPQFAALVGAVGVVAGSGVGTYAERHPEDRPVRLGPIRWHALASPHNARLTAIGLIGGATYGAVGGTAFGLAGGPALGLTVGLAVVLAFQLSTAASVLIAVPYPDASNPVDPITAWRRDRSAGIAVGAAFGLTLGMLTGVAFGLTFGPARGLVVGPITCLCAGTAIALTFVRTWDARLAFLQIFHRGQGPPRLMDFLEDAHRRDVLRAVGPVYQFRHGRLRDRLATS